MKKWIIGVVVLAVVAGVAYLILGGGLAQLSASEPTPEAEEFSTTLVVGSVIAAAVVGVGLLVYFKRHNKKTET